MKLSRHLLLFFIAVCSLALSIVSGCGARSQLLAGGSSQEDPDAGKGGGMSDGGGLTGAGGSGGNGGHAGAGGDGGSGVIIPLCGRTGTDPGPGDPYGHLKYAMAANWTGYATTPAGWYPSWYPVEISFKPDGSYHAQCLIENCIAFYYGTDADSSLKTYELITIMGNGKGWGELKVVFNPMTVQTGELWHLEASADLTKLSFEFYNTWGGGNTGPIVYELECHGN